jgi:hypothetical protein
MDIFIHDAELVNWYGTPTWVTINEFHAADGTVKSLTHMFPHDMFETIAAEYDIDTADWDTLLAVHFYRAELDHETEDEALTIFNAPTIAAARRHHLERIAEVRGDGLLRGVAGPPKFPVRVRGGSAPLDVAQVYVSAGTDDPLDVLRRESPISQPHIKAKRSHRDQHRAHRHVRLAALEQRRQAAAAPAGKAGMPARETPDEYLARMRGPRPEVKLTDEERS